ncbi:MAG: helix-turn-helix domain-containing protein [Candidatus Gastranaerophilales bacterium]|nr:helix-turn-helix domain-containing protein [Candidatus Gastranaerophilales bacterium]
MKIKGNENNKAILLEIGQRIKDNRIAQESTQHELALKSGVSDKTVARIEAGDNTKIENLLNILRSLGYLSNMELLITEQSISLEAMYKNTKTRSRVSNKKEQKRGWVWGDEK